MIWLGRYTRFLAAATLLLVAAGGMVTSTGSGLSVPDWPTTYGQSMFTFPFHDMVGGIYWEHGHRLIASTVGFLTIGLVLLQWRLEPRRWVRRLGFAALGIVILQGVLGGLTVLYFLPAPISVGHASLAQVFFATTLSLAVFSSKRWREPSRPPVDDGSLRRLALWLVGCVYGQILLGATMRHIEAGLAIRDFPLAFGHLIPPTWTPQIAVHYAHRIGALVVSAMAIAVLAAIWTRHSGRPEFTRLAWTLTIAIVTQITLGAFVVWSAKNPVINTLHVVNGAVVFGTSVVIALRAQQGRILARTAAA